MKELYKGTVVVIDNEIGEGEDDPINDIVEHIRENGCPCAIFDDIPEKDDEFISHLHSVAFLIIDWELGTTKDSENKHDSIHESHLPDPPTKVVGPEDRHIRIIELLRKIKKNLFIPVFIFTKGNPDSVGGVKQKLEEAGLLDTDDEGKNFILVKRKSEVMEEGLYDEISQFTQKSATIYVLKQWELSYQEAKSKLFRELYDKSHSWPRILWDIYKKDKSHPGQGLSDVIAKNILSRMTLVPFHPEYIGNAENTNNNDAKKAELDTLKDILEKTKFIEDLDDKSICPGDVYRSPDDENLYLVNIGGPCSTVIGRKEGGKKKEEKDIKLHLLEGRKAENFTDDHIGTNNIIEYPNEPRSYIPVVLGGELLEIDLLSLHIREFLEIKENWLGRITGPDINKLQATLSQYVLRIQQPGLPSIPKKILKDYEKKIRESKK